MMRLQRASVKFSDTNLLTFGATYFKRKHKMQILIVEKHMIISHYHIIALFLETRNKAQLTKKTSGGPSRVMNLLMNLPRSAGPIFPTLHDEKKTLSLQMIQSLPSNRFAGKLFPNLVSWLILLIKARFQLSHLRGLYATIFSLLTCLCQLAKDECVTG